MSKPENPIASLLATALLEGQKEAAHAAVTMISVACGCLIPQVTAPDLEPSGEGLVMEFHSPWRSFTRKALPRDQQSATLRKVRLALNRYYQLFPDTALPPIRLRNCAICVARAPQCCEAMLRQDWRRRCIKVVQDAIDRQGWVVGSLDVSDKDRLLVEAHGYLLNAKTSKPVTGPEWEAFAQMFDATPMGPDNTRLRVQRCAKCAKKPAFPVPGMPADPTPDAGGCDSQSFAA